MASPSRSGDAFDRIAKRYDRSNRVISMGMDQRWRRRALAALGPGGGLYLDAGAGTGDLSEMVRDAGATVVSMDASRGMLQVGRHKGRIGGKKAGKGGQESGKGGQESGKGGQESGKGGQESGKGGQQTDKGRQKAGKARQNAGTWDQQASEGGQDAGTWDQLGPVAHACVGDAQCIPLPNESVAGIITGSMLRNVPDLDRFLAEAARVLRPGGRLVILEIAYPPGKVRRAAFKAHFHHVIPRLGALITGHRDAYAYLSESLRDFPSPEGLANMGQIAGLTRLQMRQGKLTGLFVLTLEKVAR